VITLRFTISCDFCNRIVREEVRYTDFYSDELIKNDDDLTLVDMTKIRRKEMGGETYNHFGEMYLCHQCYEKSLTGAM